MRACLAAAVAILVLAGCGGGKDPADKAFADQLNSICLDSEAKLAKLVEPTSAAEIAPYANGAIRVIRAEASRIAKLDAPSDQKANLHTALSILDQQVAAAQDMARAGVAGDTAQINEINKAISRLHGQGQAIARKLGAKDCARRD
jgi:hypothetical protein